MDKRLLALALVTAVLYAPTIGYPLVYEDKNDLETFSRPWPLRGSADTWGRLMGHPQRIIRDLSFAVGGTSPMAAHAGNVGLHLLNGVLVYRLGLAWLPAGGAVLAAGLFWLHPVQVESVAYISSRSDVLAVTFALLALLAWRRVWVSLLCALLCVFTKETYAPVLLIPLVSAVRRPTVALLWGLVAGSVVAFGYLRFGRWPEATAAAEVLTQLTSLLTLWVIPSGQTIDHDWARLTTPMLVTSGLAWVVGLGLAVVYRWHHALVALGAILVLFLPRFLIPLSEGLHEHHLYGPAVALSLWCGSWVKGRPCAA